LDALSLIQIAKSKKASDLHLAVDVPPMLRVNGSIEEVPELEPFTADEVEKVLVQLISEREKETFDRESELDFGKTITTDLGQVRIRGSAAVQRGSISLSIRLLPIVIPTIEELNLPQICKNLVSRPRGLLVVTGPTGSGKSTTLAAMIEYLNCNTSRRIITVEDPLEYLHTSQKCSIIQREIGTDTSSFPTALRHVLRHDPDVILVGEVRDVETAAAALTIAETGHLVLTTGHAPSTSQAVERVIDLFPPAERHLAQTRLASLLIGILCQTLIPTVDGTGRLPALEILLGNPATRNLIREGKIYQLPSVIRTSSHDGMRLLDQALVELYDQKLISGQSVLTFCNDINEIKRLCGDLGLDLEEEEPSPEDEIETLTM
jgi:twitching motility protein PilT